MAVPLRCVLSLALLLSSVGLSQAQSNRPATTPADALVRQVRTALGRGKVDDARTMATGQSGTPAARELAMALVEVYEGKDVDARKRLQTLVAAGSNREAALELALLEQRHGDRDAANRLLNPLVNQGSLSSPDDYFVLARAAQAVGDKKLADGAYSRIEATGRADILTGAGDLYFKDHQYREAADRYRKALEADDQWVAAHLGLSRSFAIDNPPAAAAGLEGARKVAPDSPDVWALSAERALEAGDVTAARSALDALARTRPGTVAEAALRGAVAYAERQPAAIDAAIARVKDINPVSTEGYRAAGEAAARKYRFEDAATFARQAVALDSGDAGALAELGLYLMRTGDEPGARVALERSWDLDSSDVVTKNLLESLDNLDTYVVEPHGEFIFKFPKAEAEVLKPYAVPLAEEAYKTFSDRYGFKPAGPILIEIFEKHDHFAVRTVGLQGMTGALGACFGRVVTMDSPRARPPGDFSWQATEWHELAHVFTLQLSQNLVPRWLTEGISTYEEHRRVPAWGRELTMEYARLMQKGQTFGVKDLPNAFKKPQTLSMAYYEASLVVEHLMALGGETALRAVLKSYGEGATDAEALQKAYGKSINELDASFRAFVERQYGALSAALADPPQADPEDLAALKARADATPKNFYSQYAYGRALLAAKDLAAARPVLERAAALAAPVHGDGSPHGLLAMIAEQEGDGARARRELRALLAYDHTNIGAARKLAALAAKDNATEDQDIGLRLIADLDPFDGEVHSLMGRREMARGRHLAARIEFEAALALKPANPADAHVELGEAQLALNQRAEARKEALRALQFAPTYQRAQELLLAASVQR